MIRPNSICVESEDEVLCEMELDLCSSNYYVLT